MLRVAGGKGKRPKGETPTDWQLVDHSVKDWGFFQGGIYITLVPSSSDAFNFSWPPFVSIWVATCLPTSFKRLVQNKWDFSRETNKLAYKAQEKLNKKPLPSYAPPASCASMTRLPPESCWNFHESEKGERERKTKREIKQKFHSFFFCFIMENDFLSFSIIFVCHSPYLLKSYLQVRHIRSEFFGHFITLVVESQPAVHEAK